MTEENVLFKQKDQTLCKHLIELSKSLSNDSRDWRDIRVRHKQEVQLAGLSSFSDWHRQQQEMLQLADFHLKKCTALRLNQSREIAVLDELIKLS